MNITDNDFEEKVLKSKKPVLVDFWAAWCMPCNMLAPAIEKITELYKDKVTVIKANVDECPKISNEYNVDAIPNVKLFKDGKVIDEFTGVKSEVQIIDFIDKNL